MSLLGINSTHVRELIMPRTLRTSAWKVFQFAVIALVSSAEDRNCEALSLDLAAASVHELASLSLSFATFSTTKDHTFVTPPLLNSHDSQEIITTA